MTTEPLTRLVHDLSRTLADDRPADADLLARFVAARDPAAFEAIVRRHGPRVLAACRAVLRDEADAEDACQAAFVVLLRRPRAVRRPAALGPWLFGVAHRVALRARAARRRREQVEAQAGLPREDGPDLSWREACAILHEELDRLPDRYRLPLLLCYLEGLSRDEAAGRLGRTLDSVKRALATGRRLLRTRLARRGVTLSAGLLSALAAPVEGGPAPDLAAAVLRGSIRPGAVALVRTMRPRLWAAGIGLAAAALVAGIALGFPGQPKPPAKEEPAKPEARADAPADGPKAGRIAFAGRVVEPDGKPVKGARVYLLRWGEMYPGPDSDPLARPVDPAVKATTDVDGRYRFDVAATDYPDRWWTGKPHLVAAADGFGLGLLPARAGGEADGTVALVADHPITGRVINLEGQPVAGARVRVAAVRAPTDDLSAFVRKAEAEGLYSNWLDGFFRHSVGALAGPLPAVPAVTTDEKGRFELRGVGRERVATVTIEGDGIAAGRIIVLTQAGAGGRFPKTLPPRAKSGETFYRTPLDYVASPGQALEGVVTDRDTGKPIAGVTVTVGLTRTTTDRDGRYRFAGLQPARHAVVFRPPVDAPYHGRGGLGGEPGNTRPARLDVALPPGVWVTGKVIDERTRKPVTGATVSCHAAADNPRAIPRDDSGVQPDADVRTGPDGAFRLRGVPGKSWITVWHGEPFVLAGEREVQGEPDDREPYGMFRAADTWIASNLCSAIAAIDVDPARPTEHVVTLDRGVAVSIKPTDPDGKPVTGVIAYGIPRIDSRWTKPATGDTLRALAFNPDHPRPFLFLHPGRGLGAKFWPKPGDVGPWTVQLKPTATVTGRLVGPDGKPYPDASMGLYVKYPWQSDTAPAWDGPTIQTKTDAAGRFRIALVIADADCELKAFGERAALGTFPVRAKPGEVKDLGTIQANESRE